MALTRISSPVTEINGPVSLDTFTATGVWHQNQNNNTDDSYPTRVAGLLEVHALGYWVHQRYTTVYGDVYIRRAAGGSWSGWEQVNPSGAVKTASGNGWRANRINGITILTFLRWEPTEPITLPEGYRPTAQSRSAVAQENAGVCRVIVTPDGTVTLHGHDESVQPVQINGQAILA